MDQFGNVQLSLPGRDAARAGLVPGATVILAWDGGEQHRALRATFGDVAPGELLCYRDSGDWVAIAVAGGDAARDDSGCTPGTSGDEIAAPRSVTESSHPTDNMK